MHQKQSSNPSKDPANPEGSYSTNDASNPNVDHVPPSGNNYKSISQPSQTALISVTTTPNPYVSAAPMRDSSTKNTMDSVKIMFGRWAKKGQEYAGDIWQHLKTSPSITDAVVGRIAQGTKVLAEGGYDKIFKTTFQTVGEERLLKSYACYLSTSAGPVMGLLYISTVKLAFCSDNPLPYKVDEEQNWSYYKVIIPLVQLKAVQPSRSKSNPAEKFVQVISVDDHEFWFMGFVYYDSAVKNIQGAHQYPLCTGTSNC